MRDIGVARLREEPPGGRYRVLVDRLWPRGVRKEDSLWEEWLKDVAPSSGLRAWYGHDPSRYALFRQRYREELARAAHDTAVQHLLDLLASRSVVLLTATRDLERSQVPVLAAFLRETLGGTPTTGRPDLE